jgi:hypothetical protein
MLETLVALGLVAAIGAAAWAWTAVAAETLLVAGLWLVAIGLGFGLPTGVLYHVELHRSLARQGVLPARWWLAPTKLHDRIADADALRVLLPCYAGALGCFVAFAGCAVFALGALKAS